MCRLITQSVDVVRCTGVRVNLEVASESFYCTTVVPYLSSSLSHDFAASEALQSRRVYSQSQPEGTIDVGENDHETDHMGVSVCLRNPENSECGEFQMKEKKITESKIKQGPL